jgi:lysyl-tRNA synthetase class 2
MAKAATRLSFIKKSRQEKLLALRGKKINPFPSSSGRTETILAARELSGKTVTVAGRIMGWREHGGAIFADLVDDSGKIQLFFKQDLLKGEIYEDLGLLDVGDFIEATGEVNRTKSGEISVMVVSWSILAKSLRPLPSTHYSLKDTEGRYRKRYLDILLNPEVKERFRKRTAIVSAVREYLDQLGFMEVETPTLQPLYGGANAKPFKTHVNTLDSQMFLRIADELYLKRLLVGGYEKVYEICKDFRNEGLDLVHQPEFTMIEYYEAYADYQRVMDVTEGLFQHLAGKLYSHTKITVGETEVDLGGHWPRITMTEAIKEHLGLEVEKESAASLFDFCRKHALETLAQESKGQLIFKIFEHLVTDHLAGPVWIVDYPEEVSPLAKAHRSKPGWVERFEGYIGGKEICDGWSELTDPQEQRKRFIMDTAAAREDREEAQHVDEDFLEAMEYGMPPTGGIGIGIDRLTMFFTNTWSIKEVILYPLMKPTQKDIEK